jgi:plasmid stability protein
MPEMKRLSVPLDGPTEKALSVSASKNKRSQGQEASAILREVLVMPAKTKARAES